MADLRHNEFNLIDSVTAADITGSNLVNSGYAGALVFININAISGTTGTAESVTVTVEGKSPVDGGSAEYYTIIASAALVATGLVVLRIYPGLVAAANLTVSDVLPPTWRISVNVTTDGDQAYDYEVGYAYIP